MFDADGSPGGWCLYNDDKAAKFIPWEQVSHTQAFVAVYNRCQLRQQPLESPTPHIVPLEPNDLQPQPGSQDCSQHCRAACRSSSSSDSHFTTTSSSPHHLPTPLIYSPRAACPLDIDSVCQHGQHSKLGPIASVLSDARQPFAVAAQQTRPNTSKPVAKAGAPSAGAVKCCVSRQIVGTKGTLMSVCRTKRSLNACCRITT